MKSRNVVILALALMLGGPAWAGAQTARPAAVSEAATRIAVIDIQGAIGSTAEGKQKAQELTTQFTPRQTELQNLATQIQGLQQRLQDGQRTLSDEEKARLATQGQGLQRQYQRKQQELSDDENDARTEAINSIGTKMVPLIDRYAREHGYSLVLDTSQQTSPVIYRAESVDITADIVKLYDQAHPVKAAAVAPAPKSKP